MLKLTAKLCYKTYHFFGLIWSTLRYSRKPDDVALTFRFADHLLALEAYSHFQNVLYQDPAMRLLIKNRSPLQPKTLQELQLLPQGTFGKVFAQHLTQHNLDFDFYPKVEVRTDEHYVIQRMRSLHDVMHVLTGFGTSQGGELGLQGFLMAQTMSPFAMMVVGGAILFAPFKKNPDLIHWIDQICAGWLMGKQAHFAMPYAWDEAWAQPLEKVRVDLNIILPIGFLTPQA